MVGAVTVHVSIVLSRLCVMLWVSIPIQDADHEGVLAVGHMIRHPRAGKYVYTPILCTHTCTLESECKEDMNSKVGMVCTYVL